MKIAYFYRLDKFGTHERFVEEGKKLGVEIVPIKYNKLRLQDGKVFYQGVDLAEFDLWYFRSVGSELEWSKLLQLYARKLRKVVVDEYLATEGPLRRFKSVMGWQLDAARVHYPKWVMLPSLKAIEKEVERWKYPVIVKLSQGGRHGMGTFLIKSIESLKELRELYEMRKQQAVTEKREMRPWRDLLLQEFVPNDGDYRVYVVGYKLVAGFKRQMKEDKLVLNKSVGKSIGLPVVPKAVVEAAEAAARAVEVEVAGIDLVQDSRDGKVYIVEVNEAPEFKVMEKRTGVNIPGEIIKYLISKANK